MNERIIELAEQAGAEFWQRLENDVVKENAYITFDPPESLEKFAELIVKECAGLFPNVYVEIETDYGHTPVIASDYIKKHFGVEE